MEKTYRFREVTKGIFEIKMKYGSTVSDAKKQISKMHGFQEDLIRLIWNGKILPDDDRLSEIRMNDTQFIVCYVVGGGQNLKQSQKQQIPVKTKPEKEIDPKLKQIIDMGFDEEKAKKALEKYKNNVENAINYLLEAA